ncbi:hypothetical protein MHYP_G00335600 [Metynnis hypsauchen]
MVCMMQKTLHSLETQNSNSGSNVYQALSSLLHRENHHYGLIHSRGRVDLIKTNCFSHHQKHVFNSCFCQWDMSKAITAGERDGVSATRQGAMTPHSLAALSG